MQGEKTLGWLHEPIMSPEEKAERERNRKQEEELIKLRSLPSSSWCKCSNCENLENPLDNICCFDDNSVLPWLKNSLKCIVQHPGFEITILNEHVLNMVRHDLLRFVKDPDSKAKLKSTQPTTSRFLAYRNFVSWINSGVKMGKNNRVRLPACVVKKIRSTWPEPSGQYVGFKPAVQVIDFDD